MNYSSIEIVKIATTMMGEGYSNQEVLNKLYEFFPAIEVLTALEGYNRMAN